MARRRARSQGMAEFVLVAPVFFMLFGGFVLIAVWMTNAIILDGALRIGGRAANDRIAETYLTYIAQHPIVWTGAPDSPMPDDSVWANLPNPEPCLGTTTCTSLTPYSASITEQFAERNLQTDDGYAYRLGWDWGILPQSAGKLSAALTAAKGEVTGRMGGMIGGGAGASVVICFLDQLPLDSVDPADSYCASDGITGTPDLITTPAPRYLRIEVALPLINLKVPGSQYLGLGPSTYHTSTTERLLRLEPPCPIPPDEATALATGCGVLYAPPE